MFSLNKIPIKTDLNGLPSEVFYNKLKNVKNGVDHPNYCKNIRNDLPEREEILKVCANLISNIKHIESETSKEPSFIQKHCYDLNYWLFEEVSKAFNDHEKNTNVYLAIEELHKSWKEAIQNDSQNTNNKCMPERKLFKTKLLKPMKDVLDYIENFSTFKQESVKNKEKPNKYCPLILKIVPLFFMFQQLCSEMKIDICKKYVENYDNYNPSELLAKLSCVEGKTYEVQFDENLVREMINTYQSDLGNFFTKLGLPNLGLSNLDLPSLDLSGSVMSRFGSHDFSFPGVDFQNFGLSGLNFPVNLQSMFMNNIVDLVQKGFDGSGIKALFNKIPYLSEIYNYDIIHKYVVPALYGLGGLLFFFILYKCRRCLPCCCIFRRRKKRRNRLTDFDTSGLMSAPLGFPAPMMPINPYGLRYQPM
ncbi:variable surface protein Vir14-related [Plasmodium vivax]|uniref:Variable surface protein Vir14-related n=1 Tax=Plasmodium vivax (strain Salvador I) TaxID=126793 RepID=A5KCX3_PLAVS|nr:variable surface protein Vir14-related [Plasmodium vivax]EDL42794.1 variable surface protein Vir14-related [Plasmodium vivax]|eukprot:XP_001612585.1 variable surface protein Vir14-related [Plasmodium vivax Sal-1]